MRILIVGDTGGRDDEGMKRVSAHLRDALRAFGHHCTIADGPSLIMSRASWDKIIVAAGPTKNTLYKIACLRLRHWRAEIVLCGLMPSLPLKRNIILWHCVNRVVSANPQMLALARLNEIPALTQTASTFSFEKFLRGRERDKPQRKMGPLRVLHVGHLNEKRNVSELAALCRDLGFSLSFLVSRTETEELQERQRLEDMGVEIISGYQDDLFAFYRQFDLYAFPVKRADAAIAMPLSIIEALLAGLNVVSTNFGEVGENFADSDHVHIIDNSKDMTADQFEELAARPVMLIETLQKFDTSHFARTIAGPSHDYYDQRRGRQWKGCDR